MTFSFNEIEALAKKATRGAGYEWGIAEEAAKSIRWLSAFQINGCEALVSLLETIDRRSLIEMRPTDREDCWQSASGAMCPLHTGSALSDFAFQLGEHPIVLGGVLCPVIMVPFVASAARQTRSTVMIDFQGCIIVTDGTRLSVTDHENSLMALSAETVTVQKGGDIISELAPVYRVVLNDGAKRSLEQFAHRTYAPATDESRRLGAGAD